MYDPIFIFLENLYKFLVVLAIEKEIEEKQHIYACNNSKHK